MKNEIKGQGQSPKNSSDLNQDVLQLAQIWWSQL